MAMLYTAEAFIRISAKDADGTSHAVEFPLDMEANYLTIWEYAHSMRDGSIPFPPAELRKDSKTMQLWADAVRLRKFEDLLRQKVYPQ